MDEDSMVQGFFDTTGRGGGEKFPMSKIEITKDF